MAYEIDDVELTRRILNAPFHEVPFMRIQYEEDVLRIFLYDDRLNQVWRISLDRENAKSIAELIISFLEEIPTIDLDNCGVQMYG